MIWQKALKNPMLVIGIIFFGMFIYQDETQNLLQRYKARFIPSNCLSLLDRLSVHPKLNHFAFDCESEQLSITMKISYDSKLIKNLKSQDLKSLKPFLYRTLANTYKLLADIGNEETVRLVSRINFKIIHSKIEINSYTTGIDLAALSIINDKSLIINHIENTIKIKELIK